MSEQHSAHLEDDDFLLIVDVQAAFSPSATLIEQINTVARSIDAAATVQIHDETVVPFQRQLGRKGPAEDACLVGITPVFIKHGYLLTDEVISYIRARSASRVLVGGMQADTNVLAAGFRLFDEGMRPTLVLPLCQGSSFDDDMHIAQTLWQRHFGPVILDLAELG